MTFENSVSLERMPPLVELSEVLAADGWKIDAHDTSQIRAKKIKRPPSYTVGDGVTWRIEFTRHEQRGEVTITIPAMVSSVYLQKRSLDTVADLLDATECAYEARESLEFNVLAELRSESGRR